MLELDEYAEELQNVFDNISGVRLDPELPQVSRQVEIDFMSRSERVPQAFQTLGDGQWHSCHPNEVGGREQREMLGNQSTDRDCAGKNSNGGTRPCPGTFASMGPFECVMFLLSQALVWKPGASGASARKIMFMDASRAHCQADATSEMVIELPPEEQVKGEDLIGELLKSLYGQERQRTIGRRSGRKCSVTTSFEIGTWSPAFVCFRERELCGFVHGDDFISPMIQCLAWAESRLKEKLILKTRAILGPDDGDDKTVTM